MDAGVVAENSTVQTYQDADVSDTAPILVLMKYGVVVDEEIEVELLLRRRQLRQTDHVSWLERKFRHGVRTAGCWVGGSVSGWAGGWAG